MLAELELHEDLIQQGKKLIKEKQKDLEGQIEDLEYWKGQYISEFQPDDAKWWISLIGGSIIGAVWEGFQGKAFSIKDCAKGFVLGSFFGKVGLLDAYTIAYGYNVAELNGIQNVIQHQIQIKDWHQGETEEIRSQLKERCPCAL